MRLDRMSLREIEDAGQRFYEAKGRMNGEDADAPEGCCTECDGTGISGDPETNGRCWDCYGTGHPHPGPCDPDDEIIADPPERDA